MAVYDPSKRKVEPHQNLSPLAAQAYAVKSCHDCGPTVMFTVDIHVTEPETGWQIMP